MCSWVRRFPSYGRCISDKGRAGTITMTWRWLIFSSAALWLGLPGSGPAATVSGEVEITNSRDAGVRKRKNYAGVVLWLEAVDRPAPAGAAPKRPVQAAGHRAGLLQHSSDHERYYRSHVHSVVRGHAAIRQIHAPKRAAG